MKVLIVGFGKMGAVHLVSLLQSDVHQSDIHVFDVDPEKRKACRAQYREVIVHDSLERALGAHPTVAVVSTNSPAHLQVLKVLVATPSISHVLCEKPLVLHGQLAELEAVRSSVTICTGYQINFSGVLGTLMQYMKEKNVRVLSARAAWQKSRMQDTRPTSGDLEDEATHPLVLLQMLAHIGGKTLTYDVSANLAFDPYVPAGVQHKAHALDKSFPLDPVSSTSMNVIMRNEHGEASPVFINSSFTAFQQRREVELLLGVGTRPVAQILIEFDIRKIVNGPAGTPDEGNLYEETVDNLAIRELGGKEFEFWDFANTKAADQMKAFLTLSSGGAPDRRLTLRKDSMTAVRLAEAAMESHVRGHRVRVR